QTKFVNLEHAAREVGCVVDVCEVGIVVAVAQAEHTICAQRIDGSLQATRTGQQRLGGNSPRVPCAGSASRLLDRVACGRHVHQIGECHLHASSRRRSWAKRGSGSRSESRGERGRGSWREGGSEGGGKGSRRSWGEAR